MIMGAAVSTVYYNLKLRHPTLDMPIIDYDLVLLIQPMLMLGISIGVSFNVVFADWMVTVLLIILFIGIFYFGIDLLTYSFPCKALCSDNTLIDFGGLQAHQQRHSLRVLKHGKGKQL
jgi:hypothetical protein